MSTVNARNDHIYIHIYDPYASVNFLPAKDIVRLLSQMIALKGFQSCPDTPGTEKLVIAPIQRAWLKSPQSGLKSGDICDDGSLLSPDQVFAVKGYNRSLCFITVLVATFQNKLLREAGFNRCLPNANPTPEEPTYNLESVAISIFSMMI